jgi:tetratricopeptide (TPR) repeat protein/tRNA A-37 threonylcarbamoyl transferase component Bud32
MLDGSRVEERVVRDSIKARLFPSLTSTGAGDSDALEIPRIGRFAILRKLGQGGMGVVFLAYDEGLDRKVALKLLRRSRDPHRSRARLTREAQALARLSHPNVVGIHEIGEHDGQIYIAMEYVRGQTLRQWMNRETRPWREVLRVLLQAGRGLEAAHAAGLVHRDFKPDNVLVGEDGRVRVVDFGLVRADELAAAEPVRDSSLEVSLSSSGDRPLTRALTQTGAILGTPLYMPLEQHLGGPADALGDQYSFCCTAWEALLGGRPFEADTHGRLVEALRERAIVEPTPLPRAAQIPRALRAALERGLDGDPRQRWPSLGELLDRLEAGLSPRRPALAAMLGAFVIAGTLALALASVWTEDRTAPQCELGPELLAGTWDAVAATRVHDSFAATGLRYAGQAEHMVRVGLDAWAAEWLDVQRRACVATRIDALASEQLLDRRSACLGDQRAEVEGLVAILRTADERVVERSGALLDRLPDPHACERTMVIDPLDPRPLPADSSDRAALLASREQLGRVRALRAAERGNEAATLARAIWTTATDETLVREAEAELGLIELSFGREHGRRGETVERLRKLAGEAELAGDERLAAELRVELAELAADNLASPEFERWLLDDARVALERIGADERRVAWLDFADARVAQHDGELQRAQSSLIELLERADARGWPDLGASTSLQLAMLLDSLGELDSLESGEAGYVDARSRSVAVFGEGHPRVAHVDLAHAQHALARGQLEQAVALLERAEPILVGRHGHASLAHARVESTHAHLAAQEGRFDAALLLVESALAVHIAELGRDHEETARLYDLRATLRFFVGDLEGALGDYEHARRVFERRFEPGHETLVVLWANLGDTLLGLGRLREAERAFRESLEQLDQLDQLDRVPGSMHPLAAVALAGRAEIALAEGRPDAAIPDLEAALTLLDGHDGDAAERAATQLSLARALTAVGREPDRARELRERARMTIAALGLPEPPSDLTNSPANAKVPTASPP